jgi:tetratricopeptide (TPR) repeat protein
MNLKLFVVWLLMLIGPCYYAVAQSDQDKASALGKQAVELEDNNKFDEALKLLEQAQKLDPSSLIFPYEMAYSYYSKQDYQKAVEYLEKLTIHKAVIDRVFQLLGNSYDALGQSDKALEAYDRGLKIFPSSGKLFLEKGNVFWGKKDYNKALPFYEQGIKAEPSFPSNYFRASKIYCNSSESLYGMVYGEIFINLERNTKRTTEISKLLFDTYKNNIKFNGTSTTVSFSKNNVIKVDTGKKITLPFGMIYEPSLAFATIGETDITLSTLDRIRTKFLEFYYKKEFDKSNPNVLFEYQNTVKDAGHLEAYNYWLLRMGDEESFKSWRAANQEKWKSFADWYNNHELQLSPDHNFSSGLF